MITLLRLLIRDASHKIGRFAMLQALVKDLPGQFGIEVRRRVYRKHFEKAGAGIIIHQDLRIRHVQRLSIGKGVHLGESCLFQAAGGIEIGDNAIIGPGVKIWTQNHEFRDPDVLITDQGYSFNRVVIGSDVWIGADAFIMPGAIIGHGAVISAGSVVGGKPIAPYKILAGNPARIIGTRAKEKTEVAV